MYGQCEARVTPLLERRSICLHAERAGLGLICRVRRPTSQNDMDIQAMRGKEKGHVRGASSLPDDATELAASSIDNHEDGSPRHVRGSPPSEKGRRWKMYLTLETAPWQLCLQNFHDVAFCAAAQ